MTESATKIVGIFPFKKIREGKISHGRLDLLTYPLFNVDNKTIFIYTILHINQN